FTPTPCSPAAAITSNEPAAVPTWDRGGATADGSCVANPRSRVSIATAIGRRRRSSSAPTTRTASELTQVRLAHLGVREQRVGGVGQHDLPRLQDVSAIGDRQRHVRVLLDDEDRAAELTDPLDDLEHLLHEDRGE